MAMKILEKTTYSRMKRKTVTLETFKSNPSCVTMIEKVDWICAEMQKIREFQAVVVSKFTKLELANTTPVQPVELNIFNKVDIKPR